MRFCYHVQSHRSPEQLTRLVSALRRYSPDSVVHISHDVHGSPVDTAELGAMPNVAIHYHRGGYGDYSHVDRYLAAVDWLIADGVRADWLVNISGQDYPLMPLKQAEQELVASGSDGFLEYWEALGPDGHWPAHRARSRYHFHHRRLLPLSRTAQRALRPLQLVNRVQPLLRLHVAYGLTLGWRARTPFGPTLRLHGGSAFASLSWPVVEYLRDYLRRRPDVERHFRQCLSPVEAVLQTVLCSDGRFNLVADCKRYFDFTGSRLNHPRTLTANDLPRALASGAHFGRKFDQERDPGVLDALDRHIATLAGR